VEWIFLLDETGQSGRNINMLKKTTIALALLVAGTTGSMANTLNFSLDGYCNTFSITDTTKQISGSRSGCGYTDFDAGFYAAPQPGYQFSLADQNVGNPDQFVWTFTKPKGKPGAGSWVLYYSNGGTTLILQASGTYTVTSGKIPKAAAGPDASAPH
jgi:hypothetical protein